MSAEVHQFTVTIPAGTLITSPYVAELPLNLFTLDSIDLEVPPGPSGLMGFYLALSGQQWIPYEAGEWIVWDDRFDSWILTDQPTSYGWQLVGYNSDVYDHEVVVRFHLSIPADVSTSSAPVINIIQSTPPAQLVTL